MDESAFLGLGDAAATGVLGGGRQALVDSLAHFAWLAREAEAHTTTFVGTEPLRRLLDAGRIVEDVEQATGIGLHVLDHAEEAFLTLIGVTEGRPVERRLLVVDIGGGSTELVTIGPDEAAVATGIRVGAAALAAAVVSGDPPSAAELSDLRQAAARAIEGAPDAEPDEIVLVGGTVSNLLKVVPDARARRALDGAALEEAFRTLGTRSADDVAAAFGVRPARARILAAGAAIVGAILERYGRPGVSVADGGIREGTVLVTLHAGAEWRDRLPELALGWVP